MKNIVIIGNGVAGISAARHIRKLSNHNVLVISPETEHFFSRTALMYVYMGHMTYEHIKPYEDSFWKKNRIDLLQDHVTELDTTNKRLQTRNGTQLNYDTLIIATGSHYNKFGWPGQDLPGVQGLFSWQDLELMEANTKDINHAVIVGGGLIGIEMAEMLHSRNIPVTFLVRENNFWDHVLRREEGIMIDNHILEHGVDLKLATELKEIIGGKNGRAEAVVTNKGERIECQFVGLTAGVSPNIDLVKNSPIITNKGILVNEFLQTNLESVYAIGDCTEVIEPAPNRRNNEPVWYVGKMMGEVVANTICSKPMRYNPGHWYNSAKFFDIEYQVYGHVSNREEEGIESFLWQHASGKKSLRINFDKQNRVVSGFNLMGIRYRHAVCDRWLTDGCTIDHVMEHLSEANFDPEFFERHEAEIVEAFNHYYGTTIRLNKRKSFFQKVLA